MPLIPSSSRRRSSSSKLQRKRIRFSWQSRLLRRLLLLLLLLATWIVVVKACKATRSSRTVFSSPYHHHHRHRHRHRYSVIWKLRGGDNDQRHHQHKEEQDAEEASPATPLVSKPSYKSPLIRPPKQKTSVTNALPKQQQALQKAANAKQQKKSSSSSAASSSSSAQEILQKMQDKDDRQAETSSLRLVRTWTAAASSSSITLFVSFFVAPNQPLYKFYLWALLGTSCVWHLFFYLLSVGYAVGIGLPIAVVMLQQQVVTARAWLVLLWSVRLATFLQWREYKAWPAWHERIRAVSQQQRRKMSRHTWRLVTAGSWLVYTFLYFCMTVPVLLQVLVLPKHHHHHFHHHPSPQSMHATRSFISFFKRTTLLVQVAGLILESVADWQKAVAKQISPHARCTTGLWRFSTHPNYLGELLFWWGTLLGCCLMVLLGSTTDTTAGYHNHYSFSKTVVPVVTATMTGLAFVTTVLCGAVTTLDAAQYPKYANTDPTYLDFVARVGWWGPRRHVYKQEALQLWTRIMQSRWGQTVEQWQSRLAVLVRKRRNDKASQSFADSKTRTIPKKTTANTEASPILPAADTNRSPEKNNDTVTFLENEENAATDAETTPTEE